MHLDTQICPIDLLMAISDQWLVFLFVFNRVIIRIKKLGIICVAAISKYSIWSDSGRVWCFCGMNRRKKKGSYTEEKLIACHEIEPKHMKNNSADIHYQLRQNCETPLSDELMLLMKMNFISSLASNVMIHFLRNGAVTPLLPNIRSF